MAEDDNKNLTPEEGGAEEISNAAPEQTENTAADLPAEESSTAKDKTSKEPKPAKEKKSHPSKEDKENAKAEKKEIARYKKEWEDSLVASKRVKREEIKRKWRKGMLITLIVSLLMTSIVYIMLLFIEQNNIRITASSTEDKSISLSFDRENWSPYLDVDGPTAMTNVSYNPIYGAKHVDIPSLSEMQAIAAGLLTTGQMGGETSKANLIEFSFYLENTCAQDVPLMYEMTLACNDAGLENAIRVCWAECRQSNLDGASAICYASRSADLRLFFNNKDALNNDYVDGGVEFVTYPMGSDSAAWDAARFEQFYKYDSEYNNVNKTYSQYSIPQEYYSATTDAFEAREKFKNRSGYVPTVPFAGNDRVFVNESILGEGDMLAIYVCVWIEGSDLDCTDAVTSGYVTLSINFAVA